MDHTLNVGVTTLSIVPPTVSNAQAVMGDSTNKKTNAEHDTDAVMVDTTDEKTNAVKADGMDKKTYAEHDANATTSDTTDEKPNSKHDANAILEDAMDEKTYGEHDVRTTTSGTMEKKTNGQHDVQTVVPDSTDEKATSEHGRVVNGVDATLTVAPAQIVHRELVLAPCSANSLCTSTPTQTPTFDSRATWAITFLTPDPTSRKMSVAFSSWSADSFKVTPTSDTSPVC
ncbi:unnamed protein product [Phytophthora fragariaefolia]|uniref:Unnamed protein product n=1 Tax=Phytophthora fragariaefolia TaxID=1490495 RepID=A0A9W6YG37_9STRA|nr:unnamed protein product [Phytophthora fragariaefolia]